MRALLIYCHPSPTSFTAAVRETVQKRFGRAGVECREIDLYGEGFQPILSREEWDNYLNTPDNEEPVARHIAAVRWADTLIFVYPTWWYGLPAMLKGWLDRVLVPGVAFELQEGSDIRPAMRHITGLHVFTTCGASPWLTYLIGNIGRRTLLRGIRPLCHPRVRTSFLAHFLMDSSTPESRAKHLERVGARADAIARRGAKPVALVPRGRRQAA